MTKDARLAVGAHVPPAHPLAEAEDIGADCVQIFLGNPQSFKKPTPRTDADELKRSKVGVYVHAPYLINVCSPKNNVRFGSRKILQETCRAAADIGARAVIVHAGHAEDGIEEGFGRWKRTLETLETDVPLLIENTAGGNNAVGRRIETLERLWEVVGPTGVGLCFDTCHAHAAGEDLTDVVDRVRSACGRIDLVHANDSKDPHGSGRDRHTNLGSGQVDADALREMIRACRAPVICETPGGPEALATDLEFVRAALADGGDGPARG